MSEKAYVAGSAFPPLAEGTLRIYNMRFCPFSQRSLLILGHKGIPHELVNINLSSKPQWFLDRNPNGEVPVLEKDGRIVYESLVVSDYLDNVYPNSRVVPADPYRKARDTMLIDFYGKKYIPNYYKIVFSQGKDTDAADVLIAAMKKLETELANRKSTFFGGEKVAFIDYMLWPWLERYPVLTKFNPEVSMKSFPLMQQWREAMLILPNVKKLLFDTDKHLQFYEKVRNKDISAYDVGLPA